MATPSPSSPSPSLPFPSPIPKKGTPNAHPYAIKTTSTALLSRSNSTTSSPGPHHYVPTSPSPTRANHSPTKHHRPSRHRYSRSLTSDLPQSLPPPPSNQTGNPSHAYGYSGSPSPSPTHMRRMDVGLGLGIVSEPDDDHQTPRRRGQRAETLPSSTAPPHVSPPVAVGLDLPEDPKTWTPTQLSTYLASTLQAGNVDLPQPVAKDIAAFVKENRITGRTFLRLSDDDLIQYGINQLWRNTLLSSSRGLRQSTLRGRIWGFGNTPGPESQPFPSDEDPGNLSSSSTSSFASNDARGTRSRHSSSASEGGGRVRDMVESLERTQEEGAALDSRSRSTSPTKTSQRERHQSNASASPSKHSRPLPQRGNVNDLFSMSNSDSQIARTESEAAVEEKERDATITGVARKNVNGREPRLLPFPPTHASGGHLPHGHPYPQPIQALTPSHTGAGYPLPMSPQQTGYSAYGATDHELGFRSPPQHLHPHGHPDPNTQVFVVRHNPSPSRQLESNAKPASGRRSHGKRLLPYPPVVGQAELHHPRPRRLVGVGQAELDTGNESAGESESGVGGTTTGTEGYETALESQASQSESGRSTGTVQHDEGGDEEEEKTVKELLRAGQDGAQAHISGVEAWEMELGETVKRIGGDGATGAGKKGTRRDGGPGSVAEIGRKAGRTTGGSVATRGKEKESGTRRGGIMSLFEPPPVEGDEDTRAKQDDIINERSTALDAREEKLVEREVAVGRREDVVGRLEETIKARQVELKQHKSALLTKEHTLSERDAILTERETTFAEKETSFGEREAEHQAKEAVVEQRQRDDEAIRERLKEREAAVGKREEVVQAKEAALKEKEVKLKEKDLALVQREEEVDRREAEVGEERERLDEDQRKFEASRKVDLGPAPWPLPVTVNLLRKVWGTWVEPIVGEDHTPAILRSRNAPKEEVELPSAPDQDTSSASSSPSPSLFASPNIPSASDSKDKAKAEAASTEDLNPTRPKPFLTNTWAIRRDAILGGLPRLSGGYVVLMSIGMCVVVLKVLSRRLIGRR